MFSFGVSTFQVASLALRTSILASLRYKHQGKSSGDERPPYMKSLGFHKLPAAGFAQGDFSCLCLSKRHFWGYWLSFPWLLKQILAADSCRLAPTFFAPALLTCRIEVL